ncbi:MAG: T9SS type A sorting domain-containing protein [Ignavibacteriaceae bacterium]|nr:T9SS type A sorting domain-containing protein [Ignavibacteriaceae bacterium]
MKIIFTCLFLLTSQLFSQTYLNVYYSNGSQANSTSLASIAKITFSGSGLNFVLTNNSTATKDLSIIKNITFSGTDGGNPLPVELTNFISIINGNDVILVWNTAVEVNNLGFDIERNILQKGWEKIGFVRGYGNSSIPQKFLFTDSPNMTGSISYRLKQIDYNGEFQYSNEIIVQIGNDLSKTTQYQLSQNYPNPFNPATTISYSLPIDGFVSFKVFDALGREVSTLVNENKKAGSYSVVFDGSRLASGVYFGKLNSGRYTSSIKMIIMK